MSMRKAINAKRKECIYDSQSTGTWRQQVEACTSPKYPLFPLRPVSKPETPKQREKRLKLQNQGKSARASA